MKKRSQLAVVALTAVGLLFVVAAPSSWAFGSIDGHASGQQAEHERITRSLAKAGIEPGTLDVLAGKTDFLGAVGAPDKIGGDIPNPHPPSDPLGLGPAEKHCDNGDFLNVSGYPQTRRMADGELKRCFQYFEQLLDQAVVSAGLLVNANLTVNPAQAQASLDQCTFPFAPTAPEFSAKCAVLNRLGRALHLAEDFWSHTNWADFAAPGQGISGTNPPGLGKTQIPSVMRYPGAGSAPVPAGLISGCDDSIPLVGDVLCIGRVKHSAVAKDNGTIDPTNCNTATTTSKYPRSAIVGPGGKSNFVRAVCGAMKQARQTWDDLSFAIMKKYGNARGKLIMDVIKKDSLTAPNRDVTVTLLTLTCVNQEDWTGNDDIQLNVYIPQPNKRVLSPNFDHRAMNEDDATTWAINESFTYNPSLGSWGDGSSAKSPKNGSVGVEVLELDFADPNDLLGPQFIDPNKMGPGVLRLETSGAMYQLTYDVR